MKTKKEILYLYVPKKVKNFLDAERKVYKITRSKYITELLQLRMALVKSLRVK